MIEFLARQYFSWYIFETQYPLKKKNASTAELPMFMLDKWCAKTRVARNSLNMPGLIKKLNNK